MGGRGAGSGESRRGVPKGYQTIGKAGKIKIIRNSFNPNSSTGLPIKAKPNARYFTTDRDGNVKQLRFYDKNGNAKTDVDWGHGFRSNGKEYVKGTVHIHQWENGKRKVEHILPSSSEKHQLKPLLNKLENGDKIKWE